MTETMPIPHAQGKSASGTTSVIVWNAILLSIATISTVLRLWSRKKATKARFNMEDWLMVTAIPLSAISTFCSIWGAQHAQPHPTSTSIPPPPLPNNPFPQSLLIGTISTLTSLTLTKTSLCLYYLRNLPGLFLRRASQATIVFSIATCTAISFALLFACRPVSAAWDVTAAQAKDAKCIDATAVQIASSFFDLAAIAVIFTLPLPILWKAGVPVLQRIPVITAFTTGLVVLVASFTKTTTLLVHINHNSHSSASNDTLLQITTTILLNTAILASNLPTLKALLKKYYPNKFPSTTTHIHLTISTTNTSSSRRFEHKAVKVASPMRITAGGGGGGKMGKKLRYFTHERGGSANSTSTGGGGTGGGQWEGRTSCDLLGCNGKSGSGLSSLGRTESCEQIIVDGEGGVEVIEVLGLGEKKSWRRGSDV